MAERATISRPDRDSEQLVEHHPGVDIGDADSGGGITDTMEPSVIALWITAIGGFITGLAGIIMAYRKDKREDKHSDADVARLYQEIAAEQAAKNKELEQAWATKNKELEQAQECMDKKLEELEKQVISLRIQKEIEVQYSDALAEYIHYLIRLMENADIKPLREMPVRKHQDK